MNAAEFLPYFHRQLELCRLRADETVIFLTDMGSNRTVVDAGLAAARMLGARCYELRVASGRPEGMIDANPFDAPGIAEALEKTDMAICLFSAFFSRWHQAYRKRGGRILNVLDVPQQLARLQSTPALKEAALATQRRVQAARTVRVTSAAGTELTYQIDKDAPLFTHYGYVDEPGAMDHWGQGMIAMFPKEGSASGRVAVQPGDVWLLPYARLVQSRIDLEVRDGFITKIEGGLDASMFKEWLDSCRTSPTDVDPYAVSHLGWGLNPAARWADMVNHENDVSWVAASLRAFPGNFLFSTGPGHKRVTRGHIDMPMRHCTVELDGDVVVRDGRLVAPEMIVDPARCGH